MKYRINIFSNVHAMISALLTMPLLFFVFTFIDSKIGKLENVLFYVLIILIYLIVVFISRGEVEIEVTKEKFKHKWIRKFIFSNEEDIELDWNQVVNCGSSGWRLYEFFQLTLIENRKYRIYRFIYSFKKDDFKMLINDIPKFQYRIMRSKIKS